MGDTFNKGHVCGGEFLLRYIFWRERFFMRHKVTLMISMAYIQTKYKIILYINYFVAREHDGQVYFCQIYMVRTHIYDSTIFGF